jgi:DNA-binding SARP family transcriptional activator/tetratricopeptide (TPR) repeat protein
MEFRILGPVEVWDGSQQLDLGGPKPRALLAVLLLQTNQVVPTDRLVDELWGEASPPTARNLVQVYVSRLRQALHRNRDGSATDQVLVTRPSGYLLRVKPGELDLDRFEGLTTQARRAAADGDLKRAAECWGAALVLWRGPALAGAASEVLRRTAVPRLEEARLVAVEERLETDLSLGRHVELVGELEVLVGEHPLRERLRRQLMLALYRSGRRAEALAVYRSTRQVLVEELGLEPSPALQELERAILLGHPAPAPAATTRQAGHHPALPVAPCQLPPDIDDFTGREATTAQVQRLLESEEATAIVISAIAGKAGVGKTALAVHLAHRLRPHFPDGQLYVNLRGAEAQALDPPDVLAMFLRALGVDGARIPEGLEERVQQYRARLADRRVLVVLDNAASEAQVRPLLPAGRGCAALVTTRAPLSGLEAAHPLTLEVLEADQAVQLLDKLAGPGRVAAEPQAALQIVGLCGLLPLALRIAGARLASRPQWPLALLAQRLADEQRRLDELKAGDLEVRASFALSHQGRKAAERRLFRLLGLLVAPSFPAWVAAALLDTESADAEALLERLVDAQLVEAAGQDQAGQLRYRLHDLLGVFARERLHDEEPASTQRASLERLLGAYLTLAERADALLKPSGSARYGSDPGRVQHTDHPAAAAVDHDLLGWFEAERASLVAAVQQAGDAGLWELCWRLAGSLAGFFQDRTHWDDWQHTNTLALAAARRTRDRNAEARVLGSLGDLHTDRHRLDDAICCLQQSRAVFREAGNRRGELHCLLSLADINVRQGRFADATARLEQCLAGSREFGWRSEQARALYNLGDVHHHQGRLEEAIGCLEQALTLMRAVGDRGWEAPILRSLGLVHSTQGRFGEAIACLNQSLAAARASRDHRGQAYVLQSLGEVRYKQGRLEDAVGCLEQGLALARATGDRIAEAYSRHTLGDVRRQQGRLEEAAECLECSLTTFRDLGFRRWEAQGLNSLGMLLIAKGEQAAACSAWRIALAIFRELDMPEAAEVAAWLDR